MRPRRRSDWLRDHLPHDAEGQAAVLSRFIVSIAESQPKQANDLLAAMNFQFGAGHRRAMIAALQSGKHPDRALYSAMLVHRDLDDGWSPRRRSATFPMLRPI